MKNLLRFAVVGAALLALSAGNSRAMTTLGFDVYQCAGCSSLNPAGVDFELTVTVPGSGPSTFSADLEIANTGSVGALLEVFFENLAIFDGTHRVSAPPANTVGNNFLADGTGDPQGKAVINWGTTLQKYKFSNISGPGDEKLNPGESVTFTLGLVSDLSEAAVVGAIVSGQSVALHVGECETGKSCQLVATPIPGAVWLLASALIGLVGVGRFKGRKAEAAA